MRFVFAGLGLRSFELSNFASNSSSKMHETILHLEGNNCNAAAAEFLAKERGNGTGGLLWLENHEIQLEMVFLVVETQLSLIPTGFFIMRQH